MNFLNFLSSGAKLFNFNLVSSDNINSSLFQSSNNPSTSVNEPMQVGFKETKTEKNAHQLKNNISVQKGFQKKSQNLKKTLETKQIIQEIIINQQQQLINQYLHLNLQLINKRIQEQTQKKNETQKVDTQSESIRIQRKKIKKINTCGHEDKQHYAKGMCNNCYHKYGRTKKPWNCPHQKLYASGMCQNCYINKYNKIRRQKDAEQKIQEDSQLKN